MPTLNWIGKDKVIAHHQEVPYRVLEHQYGFDGKKGEQDRPTNSGNRIIHGDNLEALKSLLPEYEGKIKCIYIDPPYNTGNENWVYNDNVNHPKIKKWLGEVVGKEGDDLSRHDKWLCMMYPRLQLLYKLLAEDGAIFMSIDDNEQANLKLICDDIFGQRNFLVDMIWQHSVQPKGYKDKFSIHHNHTLIYQKSDSFELRLFERREEDNKAYSNPDDDPKGSWRSGDVRNALYRPNLIYDLETPSGKEIKPPKKGWRWSKSTMQAKIKTGEVVFNENETSIKRKIYLKDQTGRPPESIWFAERFGSSRTANKKIKDIFGRNTFETSKPVELIEGILKISTLKNDVILDSFAGSGTTAQAVLNLNKEDDGNRNFILVEMEEYANAITAERVKRVINGYDYKGKTKAVLKEYSTNITNLKKSEKIIQEYERFKKDKSYSKVKVAPKNGKIAIIGEKKISGETEGLGGSFDYYELGKPLFDENENLNEEVGLEKIREYIWFSETRSPFKAPNQDSYFLGTKEESAYYFIYEKDRLTTLDFDSLEVVQTQAEQYIIYADNCLLPHDFRDKHNIIFKKIPRDITRF